MGSKLASRACGETCFLLVIPVPSSLQPSPHNWGEFTPKNSTQNKRARLHPRVLGFGLLQDGNIGVGVFPEGGVRGKSALALPDAHAVGWREVELISGLDIERCVPRVEVAHRSRPELVGGMYVGHHCLAKKCFTRL